MDHSSTILEPPPPQPNGVLDDGNLLRNVLSYVGKNQYRFIGTVDHTFHDTYVSLHPEKTTQYNVSSMEHAVICCNEVSGYNSRYTLSKKAATTGNLPVLQFLFSNKCPIHRFVYQGQGIHRFFYQRQDRKNRDDLFTFVLQIGHIHVLQWLYEMGEYPKKINAGVKTAEWAEDTLPRAIKSGRLDIVQWLFEHGCTLTGQECQEATKHGQLDILQWLFRIHCPCDEDCFKVAVENGHLEVIQWLHGHGYSPMKEDLYMEIAVFKESVEVMEWLHANGFPYGARVFFNAAFYGRLRAVQWLLDHDCPYFVDECTVFLLRNCDSDTLQRVLANRCWIHHPDHTWTSTQFHPNVEVLQLLHDNHIAFDPELVRRAVH